MKRVLETVGATLLLIGTIVLVGLRSSESIFLVGTGTSARVISVSGVFFGLEGSDGTEALLNDHGAWAGFHYGNWGTGRFVAVPQWFVLVVPTLLFFAALWGFVREGNRERRGWCPKCGYDIRATPERCSECGYAFSGSGFAGRD